MNNFLNFFIGFAGGSFLTATLVNDVKVIGSLLIGLLIGVLYYQLQKSQDTIEELIAIGEKTE